MWLIEKLFLEEGKNLDVLMMSLRAVLVFWITLFMIRIGKKRFLGRNTAFDIVLSIIIGSLLARTINGSAPLLPSFAAAFFIVLLHYVISFFISRYPGAGGFLQGKAKKLMENGKINKAALLEHHLTSDDLMEAVRKQSNRNDLEGITQCFLENDGQITVVVDRDR